MRDGFYIARVIEQLEDVNLLPAIVFRSARSQCDEDVEIAGSNRNLELPAAHREELIKTIKKVVSDYEMDAELIRSHPHYYSLITSGVGAHHAGQLLMWRLLLEELMSKGLLRVLVATGTVAAGVDFPARTVVITAHSKRGADGFRVLTSSEFQQMSGRAGRRGKDTVGFCVAVPSQFCDARSLLKIAHRPPEPLVSVYFPSASTVLNLLRYRNVDGLRYTIEKSLASFGDLKNAKILKEQALDLSELLPKDIKEILFKFQTNQEKKEIVEFIDPPEHLVSNIGKEKRNTLKKVRRLVREAKDLETRQLSLLDSALQGLSALGYLEDTHLSEKGHWAANLCTSLVLEMAEVIESGLFSNPNVDTLIAVVASIAADSHRPYLPTKTLVLNKQQETVIRGILEKISMLNMPGVSSVNEFNQGAAYTALTWSKTENWQGFRSLLLFTGVAEGDVARLITQTAEQLNQITRLNETHPQLALKAEEAKKLLLRPPLSDGINLEPN
ncbi:MAG: hypothetical protein KBC84_02520 [Proteobacteria bacterium]|nr:hypothetical protein [Pseudomonadota bacterium]